MADSLYLSIWFPSFREGEMMLRTLSVLRQFPFSALREGITYMSVHPVSWAEPTVLECRSIQGFLRKKRLSCPRVCSRRLRFCV